MNPNVDFTETTSCLEWCAGYGGISLGLKRAIPSLRTIAFGEIEAFACANLVAKMEAGLLDPAPIWTDLKTFPCEQFRDRVDILVAGYPCQPFSAAGKRLGTEDPRHLWPFIQRSISIIRPRLCFFENVEGHITLGLSTVISDLEELGYKVAWGIFSASEVGAPHQRKRVFILACRASQRGEGESLPRWISQRNSNLANNCGDTAWPSRPGEPQHGWEPPRVVGAEAMGNAASERPRTLGAQSKGQQREASAPSASDAMGHTNSPRPQKRPGQRGAGIQGADADGREAADREIKFAMGLRSYGTSVGMGHAELSGLSHSELDKVREWMVKCDNRTDELRLLGNGVVPATAERAFRVLMTQLLTADTQ